MVFKFRKSISFILVFCLCISVPVKCFAVENVPEAQQSYLNSKPTKYTANDYTTLVEILRDAVIECKEVEVNYSCINASNVDLNALWRTVFNSQSAAIDKDYVSDFVDDIMIAQFNRYIVSNSQVVISQDECTIAIYNINYSSRTDKYIAGTIDKMLDDAISELNIENLTRYEKTLKIHDWICDNFEYDYSINNITMRDGFNNGTMICTTYANIFFNMLNRAGVPCRLICGAGSSQLHGWNLVQMSNDKWYYVDVTWNDGLSSKTYFLSGTAATYSTHTVDSLILACLNTHYDIPYDNYTYILPIDPLIYTDEKSFTYNERDDSDVKITGIKLNDAKDFTVYIDNEKIMMPSYSTELIDESQIITLNSLFLHTLSNGNHTISIIFDDERTTSVNFDLSVSKLVFKDEGKTKKLKVKDKYILSKDFGDDYTIKFSSSNKKIIKVNAGGTVTAVKKGKAHIIATVTKGLYSSKFIVNFNISQK